MYGVLVEDEFGLSRDELRHSARALAASRRGPSSSRSTCQPIYSTQYTAASATPSPKTSAAGAYTCPPVPASRTRTSTSSGTRSRRRVRRPCPRLPDVVLVAGRDPRSELGGGHSSYVRAHGFAALAAGFTPHLVCVGASADTATTAWGVVHRVESSRVPYRQLAIPRTCSRSRERSCASWRTPARASCTASGPGAAPRSPHGHRLRKRAIAVRALASSYTTLAEETRSKVEGLAPSDPVLSRLLCRAEACVDPKGDRAVGTPCLRRSRSRPRELRFRRTARARRARPVRRASPCPLRLGECVPARGAGASERPPRYSSARAPGTRRSS